MAPLPFGFLALSGAGGGAGAYDLLGTTTLTSIASSVTFSGLGAYSGYKHLQLRGVMRSSHPFSTLLDVDMRMNGISTSVYSMHSLNGSSASGTVGTTSSITQAQIRFAEMIPSSASYSNVFSPFIVDILDYSNPSKNTTIRALRGANATDSRVQLTSGLYQQTTAVTSFSFTPVNNGFLSGTRFSLYGVKG